MKCERKSVGWSKQRRYEEAGALADEIYYGCHIGKLSDHNIWAAWFYDHPWAIPTCRERAYLYASLVQQGRLDDAITAFQSFLNKLGRGGAQ